MRLGKKIGTLVVHLDRKRGRYKHAEVAADLRFHLPSGTFYADWEGKTYEGKSKDELSAKIKVVATKALSFNWTRYIFIDYGSKGWPLEDEEVGRPLSQGQYTEFGLDDERDEIDPYDKKRYVVCGISLHWALADVSDPYPLPEEPEKLVRSMREVDVWQYGDQKGQEHYGQPKEWKNADLPAGAVPWTPEREAVLAEILRAIGKLDARMLELFRGSGDALAKRLDAAQTDPSRLLAAPAASRPVDDTPGALPQGAGKVKSARGVPPASRRARSSTGRLSSRASRGDQ